MIQKIISTIRGIFTLFLHMLNLFLWGSILFVIAFIRFLIPLPAWRKCWYSPMNHIPALWVLGNNLIIKLTTSFRLEIDDLSELNPKGWYLVLPNHQTWLDIIILMSTFSRKIPLLKFFMKKQLLWVPFVGLGCYVLDFPFMGRYTKDYLKKHPEKKGKDIETTRKACEKFKTIPTSILNFCEGTRFTREKHHRQSSPFKHLLKPKAGGIAFVLSIMGEYLHQILDVTLIYPQKEVTLWKFFCGQVNHVIVKIRLLPLNPELIGDYETDTAFRLTFQKWLNELWREKDNAMSEIMDTPIVCKHYLKRDD